MDVEGFKQIYYVEWLHRVVARSIGVGFLGPLAYFWYRGYLQSRMKTSMALLFAFGAFQGIVGWWMVKSGLVDKEKTKELDKTPTVSPYRLTFHAYNAYFIYGVLFWLSLHLLRRPQEAVITLKNMADHNAYRNIMKRAAHGLMPIVLLTGFFTAGIQGRHAVNTFPKVGDHWFINRNHFNWDIPFWKNFTENKLVVQVTHRTLACLFGLLTVKSIIEVNKLKHLSPAARRSFYLFLAAIAIQVTIGISTVWNPEPVRIANSHQVGAVTVLTALIFAIHTARRVDPRHIRNLLGKLKAEDPQAFQAMMANFNKQVMSKKEYEMAKKEFFK